MSTNKKASELSSSELRALLSEKEKQEEEAKRSTLENDFRNIVNIHREEISSKLHEAEALLDEAVKIAEEHGIPFYANVSPISQNYTPRSFREKFSDVDSEVIYEVLNGDGPGRSVGWQHSAVC
jgi:ATP-dependent protease HslVU (ClpYQ) ATPase subunit